MMIYLDNCSTTRMRGSVLEVFNDSLRKDFFNPSALYNSGYEIEKSLNEARKNIANYLNVNSKEVIFTSGGTESNNMAISMAVKNRGRNKNHIITSQIEHSSIRNYMKYLEEDFDISYIPVDSNGLIDPIDIKNAIKAETFLISIGHVNSEIGVIQDINAIGELIKDRDIFYHIDGVQAIGKIPFTIRDSNADFYTFSGHKIYGPKGIGGIYINSKNNLKPVIYGGNQEFGIRSGTENYPAIKALEKAFIEIYENFEIENKHILDLKKIFLNEIKELDDIKVNSNLGISSPYIINISIKDIMGEVLLHYLADEEDIFISIASACSANSDEKSHVIRALNINDNYLDGTIRLCLSYDLTEGDIITTADAIKKYVKLIREITRR